MSFESALNMLKAISASEKSAGSALCAISVRVQTGIKAAMPAVKENNRACARLQEALDALDELNSILTYDLLQDNHLHEMLLSSIVSMNEQKKQAVAHNITDPGVRAEVWRLTGGKCSYCGIELAGDGDGNGPNSFCVEHVVPSSYGGPNNLRNYVPSCRTCNTSKGDKNVLLFINANLARRMGQADVRVVSNGDTQ